MIEARKHLLNQVAYNAKQFNHFSGVGRIWKGLVRLLCLPVNIQWLFVRDEPGLLGQFLAQGFGEGEHALVGQAIVEFQTESPGGNPFVYLLGRGWGEVRGGEAEPPWATKRGHIHLIGQNYGENALQRVIDGGKTQ